METVNGILSMLGAATIVIGAMIYFFWISSTISEAKDAADRTTDLVIKLIRMRQKDRRRDKKRRRDAGNE